jgi:hypothetical protein
MSSNPHRQQFKTTKAKQLSQKLQVQAKTGEKSPVRAGTSPVQTYVTRTRSEKILAMTEPEPQPDKEFDEAGTDYTSFTKLHTLVYETTSKWATKHPMAHKHKFFQLWLSAWRDKIQATSTYNTVKQKLHLQSLADYKEHIIQCPAITKRFDIWLNHTGYKIRYSSITPNLDKDSLEGTSPESSIKEEEEVLPPLYADMMDDNPDKDPDVESVTNNKTEPEEQPATAKPEKSGQENATYTLAPEPTTEDIKPTKIEFTNVPISIDITPKIAQTTIDDSALQDLLIDIEEETSPAGTTIHQNRFYHWMADRMNHRMGKIGNYLKDAKHHLDEKMKNINNEINRMETTVTQVEAKIDNFATTTDTIISNAYEQLSHLQQQNEQHLKAIEQKMANMSITISETCQYYESQIKSYCKQEEEEMKEAISEAIVSITQEAIDNNINLVLQEHLHTIQDAANEVVTDIKQEKLKASQSSSPQPQKLPPTPWNHRGKPAQTAGPSSENDSTSSQF